MRRKIRVGYVAVIAVAMVLCTLVVVRSLDRSAVEMQRQVNKAQEDRAQLSKTQSDLQNEVGQLGTPSYIIRVARSQYHFLAEGEILFVVENPEALYDESPQLIVTVETQDSQGEETL